MTQLSIPRYKKVGGANLFKALRAIPLLLILVCIVSSCSKDEDSEYTIEDLYEESKTLQYQTGDSVEAFTYKFYWYLEAHPDAQDHPYYTAIDDKIDKCAHGGGVTVNTDWDGERHLEF